MTGERNGCNGGMSRHRRFDPSNNLDGSTAALRRRFGERLLLALTGCVYQSLSICRYCRFSGRARAVLVPLGFDTDQTFGVVVSGPRQLVSANSCRVYPSLFVSPGAASR